MNLVLWIVRLIILVMIVRFIVGLVTSAMRPRGAAPRPPGRPQERIGGTLVQDPQCGTYLPQERAVALARGGDTHYFCSTKCRDEWTNRA